MERRSTKFVHAFDDGILWLEVSRLMVELRSIRHERYCLRILRFVASIDPSVDRCRKVERDVFASMMQVRKKFDEEETSIDMAKDVEARNLAQDAESNPLRFPSRGSRSFFWPSPRSTSERGTILRKRDHAIRIGKPCTREREKVKETIQRKRDRKRNPKSALSLRLERHPPSNVDDDE